MTDARDALASARERHRNQRRGRRAAVIAGGWVVGAFGLLLVVPVPELGLPLLLVGLRLLALRYDWAARAYLPVARLWGRIMALSASVKIALGIAAAILVAAVVWSVY